jgi:hypothetical protein
VRQRSLDSLRREARDRGAIAGAWLDWRVLPGQGKSATEIQWAWESGITLAHACDRALASGDWNASPDLKLEITQHITN